ncbi:hypothetical protein B5F83_10165 [Muribaculum sp. An289]|uniref:SUMF1/EgtB/PvdO family nonheme iron enzyme n=1 Tax=unclassified Muribaculum TaxID=2622126 RepID=UPI000B373D2D|nr:MULTISPECIES: SUMF1/EgtB/PvdO family nonheme iron enzyme [unclassified Muribaculum]OUO35357.1 hypothetical protein B5F83_10165 [Muribaculum sp. An289]OUO40207.1 hypothetical protein B5F81_10235 [Muribaculum sp. An287]
MKNRIFSLILTLSAVSVFSFISCTPQGPDPDGDGDGTDTTVVQPVKADSIAVEPQNLTLNIGETQVLQVEIYPEEAAGHPLTWTSSDESVVTVGEDGTVTAIASGDATVTVACDEVSADCLVTVQRALPLDAVLIPAGTFLMGTPETEPNRGENEVQHEVTISKDFYMGKYEVTNEQFAEFLNDIGCPDNGYYEISEEAGVKQLVMPDKWGVLCENGIWAPSEGFENFPVICVTWYGADEYAKWIGGSLPTEAQWEYACRGGQTESLPFGIGDGTRLTYELANFRSTHPYDVAQGGEYEDPQEDYRAITTEVGSFEPNGYGLYDMHGNVYEYCSDWYGDYPEGPVTDPSGPDSAPDYTKVIRGGGWFIMGQYCRSGERDHFHPDMFDIYIGFRVVFAK